MILLPNISGLDKLTDVAKSQDIKPISEVEVKSVQLINKYTILTL